MGLKCCVFGLGYIGLPTACLLAKAGYKVTGVDINHNLVEELNHNKVSINEPGLRESLYEAIDTGNFTASIQPVTSDIYLIAVPTPFKNTDSKIPQPNIENVISSVKAISKVIQKNQMILIESTCPVGTTRKVASLIENLTNLSQKDFSIAYCPERVLPGNILSELIDNDRVVGGISETDSLKAKSFYKTFCKGEVHETKAETAELVKLTENSYRDVNIAFANELSIICSSLKIDISELINLANHHPRVNILNPGAGVGGHCIAVDPWFIVSQFPNDAKLIKSARLVNNYKTDWVIQKIKEKCESIISTKNKPLKVGCMGISFKPNVNDLRESPALKITFALSKIKNIKIYVCDPNINNHNDFEIHSIEKTIENCDLFVFLVAHKEFKNIDLDNLDILDFCHIKTT